MNILPDKKEHDRLGAGHVNTLNRAARMVLAKNIGGYGFGGPEGSFSGVPPFVQQQCQIVALGFNTTDDSGDSSGSPLQEDLYTIRFYYWDQDSLSWKVDYRGEGYLLDDKLQQSNYSVGDKVTAYWDAQRNAFCPIKSGGEVLHGIVSEVHEGGYYTIELGEWNGTTPAEGEIPDPCEQMTGSGAGSSDDNCEDITLPEFDSQLIGLGVFVLAYDPQSVLVPLVVGSDVKMVDMGDENAIGSQSHSQSSGETEPVFQIIRGFQNHIVEYKDEKQCCNGVWTLISRKAIIFAAKVCDVAICDVCIEE